MTAYDLLISPKILNPVVSDQCSRISSVCSVESILRYFGTIHLPSEALKIASLVLNNSALESYKTLNKNLYDFAVPLDW